MCGISFASHLHFENTFCFEKLQQCYFENEEVIYDTDVSLDQFEIIEEDNLGLGVRYIGKRSIGIDKVLIIGWGYISDRLISDDDMDTALEIVDGIFLINSKQLPMSPLGLVNHSCDPNCIFYTAIVFDSMYKSCFYCPVIVNTKTIRTGDFLSVDYGWTPNEKCIPIPCNCKTKKCKKWLRPPYHN